MKSGYKALIIAGLVAATGIAVTAGTGFADERGRDGRYGISQGDDDREYRRGRGRGAQMLENFDTDGDGQLTQAEIDAVRADRFAEFDTDGNGELTLQEYEALWLDAMRERMVDRFQNLDNDGDAIVTSQEFVDPFASMVSRMDHNGDGVLNTDDMTGRGQGRGDGRGRGNGRGNDD